MRAIVLGDPAPFVPLAMTKRRHEVDYGAKAVTPGGLVWRNGSTSRRRSIATSANAIANPNPSSGPPILPGSCPATLTASPLPTAGSSPSNGERVTFKWKDYRAKLDARYKLMTLDRASASAAQRTNATKGTQ